MRDPIPHALITEIPSFDIDIVSDLPEKGKPSLGKHLVQKTNPRSPNAQAVYEALCVRGGMSLVEITNSMNLSRYENSRAADELLEFGYAREVEYEGYWSLVA